MYFDPRVHTLEFIRSRSSFLLAVILAVATTYTAFNTSPRLHMQLMEHVMLLESRIRNEHFKSVEIVQALLLLASWSELPVVLTRDKTWLYISHAICLAIELGMDAKLPYCVESDSAFEEQGDLLLRSCHRVCYLLFIHDRVSCCCDLADSRTWQWCLGDIRSIRKHISSRGRISQVGERTRYVKPGCR